MDAFYSLFRVLCSVRIISGNSSLQLAPRIKPHELWCQAMVLILSVPLSRKMSVCKLIHYFSSHPEAFGFQASWPPDNITLNPSTKRTDQILSNLQTGIGAAAHPTLD